MPGEHGMGIMALLYLLLVGFRHAKRFPFSPPKTWLLSFDAEQSRWSNESGNNEEKYSKTEGRFLTNLNIGAFD